MASYFGDTWLVRLLLQRGLAVVFVFAFISSLRQFPALLGERGLLPFPAVEGRIDWRGGPSLFQLHYNDRFFRGVAWSGIVVASLLALGLTDRLSLWLAPLPWLYIWLLYLSIVNVGQTFYGFGWETMLLEAGFFAAFLGPSSVQSPLLPVLILRFMLFRTELGAGLIKLRHDSCWRDLTCLYYHYETQPLPNPLSWYFHHLPRRVHRAGVVFSHFVQVVAPFGLFLPQPIAAGAGVLIVGHQLLLIASGNYGWLNWLTVVLGFSAFEDSQLSAALGLSAEAAVERGGAYDVVLALLGAVTALLSIQPIQNLFSRQQRMNASYNPLHLVNSYGAFGAVTRDRYELVIEGTSAGESAYREYGFHGKPGDPQRRPPVVAPYQLRLDWALWFLPLRGMPPRETWFHAFLRRLLHGDPSILALLRDNPFRDAPPHTVRAVLYSYRFTDRSERRATGAWWKREQIGEVMRVGGV